MSEISYYLLGLLIAMLLAAAIWDMKSRTIPNSLNTAITLGAIPYWIAIGLPVWPDVAIQIGIGLLVFAVFAAVFAIGAMGGGDVKMVAALALWLPPAQVLMMIAIMSIAGGVLTLVMLIWHKAVKSTRQLEIPYGVAIAVAGVLMVGERFLNHFS